MSTKLWYDEFVNDWMWALPLGNGRIGAMIYGNPHCEQIEINEESLWCGRQIKEKYHASPEALKEIRRLVSEEKLKEAAQLARKTFLSDPPVVRSYESFGEIFIDFLDKSPVSNYRKELELSEAVARIFWTKSKINFKSECFVSEDFDGFVYKVESDDKPFSCNISIKRKQDAYSACVDADTIIMNGRITYKTHHHYGEGGEGMSFGAELRIKTDGELTADHSTITVADATYFIIYSAFETNYNVNKFDVDETIDFKSKLNETISNFMHADYEKIKDAHISAHKKWFGNVQLELEKTNSVN